MELPKIVSVDDHVVEPAHVWQTWLPEKWRERGPKVERKKWGDFKLTPGAHYVMNEDPDDLRRDAPRLLRARRAHQGLRAQLDRRLASVPHVPAVLRPDVLRDPR